MLDWKEGVGVAGGAGRCGVDGLGIADWICDGESARGEQEDCKCLQ